MAAHRYWRIYFTALNGSSPPYLDKIEFLAGGVNVATNAANASASTVYSASYAAGNAVIGQGGQWSATVGVPGWWAYDLGTSSSADISAVRLTLRSDSYWNVSSPTAFNTQWSDDNATWTTYWSATPTPTAAGQIITSNAPVALTPSPASVTSGTVGQVIAITGTGLTGASFALTGGLGAVITAQSVASATSASVTLSPGLLGFGGLSLTASTGGSATVSVAAPALGAVALGFIGGSITVGVNGSPPATVASTLTAMGYSVTTVNRGISGATTQDWLPSGTILGPAITAIKAAGCTAVLVMLGTNDVRTPLSLTPAQHNVNLAQIVQALVSAGLQVVLNKPILTIPNSGSGATVWPNDPNSFYIASWALNCRLANGVNVFCGDTTGFEQSQINPQSYLSSDGVNPSSAGNTALGQAWAAGWLQRYGPAISRWTH